MNPKGFTFLPASPSDFERILALNLSFEHYLSPLSAARLALLHSQACAHLKVAIEAETQGFIMLHKAGSTYDSVNYQWFARHFAASHTPFWYIDRVVIAQAAQGMGVAQALYTHVFEQAAADGAEYICCEYDLDPPNPRSERFHASIGFVELAQQTIPSTSGTKRVSMQQRMLTEAIKNNG